MRITLGKFVLCEGTAGNQFPDSLGFNGKRVVDVAEFLRAADAVPSNRGNRKTTFAFTLTREHASHRAACEFAAMHEWMVPEVGAVVLQLEGDGVTKLTFTNGVLEEVACDDVFGVSTIHTYSFIGSRLEKIT